jgi:hypothetical protein
MPPCSTGRDHLLRRRRGDAVDGQHLVAGVNPGAIAGRLRNDGVDLGAAELAVAAERQADPRRLGVRRRGRQQHERERELVHH